MFTCDLPNITCELSLGLQFPRHLGVLSVLICLALAVTKGTANTKVLFVMFLAHLRSHILWRPKIMLYIFPYKDMPSYGSSS